MAGKIALGLLVAIMIGATCYAAGWYRREETKIECLVMRVVTEEDGVVNNPGGLKPPYTIVGADFAQRSTRFRECSVRSAKR